MRDVIALVLVSSILGACTTAPQKERVPTTSFGPNTKSILRRQPPESQEKTTQVEDRLAEWRKKLGVLGQLVRKLSQRQSRLETRLEQIARGPRPTALATTPQRSLQTKTTRTPREAYNAAYRAIRAKRNEEAILLFRNFLRRYPKSQLAGNAQYWLGESYYDLREFPASLEEFLKVIKHYPKSRKVPDAYYKRGLTYLQVRNLRRAALEFKKLLESFPDHHLTKKAWKKLQFLHLIRRRKLR